MSREKEEALIQKEIEKELLKKNKKNPVKKNSNISKLNNERIDKKITRSENFKGNLGHEPVKNPEKKRTLSKSEIINKKQNSEIVKTSIFFAIIFFSMIGFYTYYVSVNSLEIMNNPYNARLDSYSDTIIRGGIYSRSGKLLAYTDVDDYGNEIRVYPYKEIFSHVVGMNDKGKSGLEKKYDYYLLTTNTNMLVQILNEFKEEKSIGNDVVTTLSCSLQKAAYESLGDYDGAVVAIENSTGKILSMVSKPDFDPNKMDVVWDKIEDGENQDSFLLNRATHGLYTPGSIFKIFTALEFIDENKDFEKFEFYCDGKENFANYDINCYNKKKHGNENLTDAFAYSCNGAFAQIGVELKPDLLLENMNNMLFNKQLPIDIEHKKSKFYLDSESSVFDITQTSIGQGKTLVTPIHMAMICQAICNDGNLMIPYLVTEIDGVDGSVIKKYEPKSYGNIIDKKHTKTIKKMMESVTEYGTGKIFANSKYKVGGKTGTAQIDDDNNVNSWFLGYGKYEDKDITLCVVIEDVPDGSIKAVECAKKIFDSFLK